MTDSRDGMLFKDFVSMLQEDGFEVVRATMFTGSYGHTERHVVMWKADEGLLATAESFMGKTLNDGRVHYNIVFDRIADDDGESTYWTLISSGGFHKASYDAGRYLWSGDHNVRFSIRSKLAGLRTEGTFQPTWTDRPWLNLLNYMEWKQVGQKIKKSADLTEAVLAELPEHVRTAITPKEN